MLAFQKWEGLSRDGTLGPQTLKALATAQHPDPITQGPPGKRAEVLLDRQVALAIDDNKVVRVIPVSTGKPSTPTPPGDFTVYAKIARWWSTPFREWLLWAVPFNGGVAFHEFPEVPAYAASHGCVRQLETTAKWMYDFSVVGPSESARRTQTTSREAATPGRRRSGGDHSGQAGSAAHPHLAAARPVPRPHRSRHAPLQRFWPKQNDRE